MTYANWMEAMWDTIKDQSIWHIGIPGTHNSGVYSAWNTIGVRNQDKTIGEQLNGGIRALDIRVTNGHGTFVMHHSGNYPPNNSQHLSTAVDEIASFIAANSNEIIIIFVRPGSGSNLSAEQYPDVRRVFTERLADKLTPWDDNRAYTPAEIIEKKQNVIIISKIGEDSDNKFFWEPWDNRQSDTWEEYQSSCKHTYGSKMSWLKPHIEQALKKRDINRKKFLYASCMLWSINLSVTAGSSNPSVASWIDEWSDDPELLKAMNIFVTDFYEKSDSVFVSSVIGLNMKKPVIATLDGDDIHASADLMATALVSEDMPTHPHFANANSFDLAGAFELVDRLGIDAQRLVTEYETHGAVSSDSLEQLETSGLSEPVVSEFLAWYEATGSKT